MKDLVFEKMSDKRQSTQELDRPRDLPPVSGGPRRKQLVTIKTHLSPINPELKNILAAVSAIKMIHGEEMERISESNNSSEAVELLEDIMEKVDDITSSVGQITKLIRK